LPSACNFAALLSAGCNNCTSHPGSSCRTKKVPAQRHGLQKLSGHWSIAKVRQQLRTPRRTDGGSSTAACSASKLSSVAHARRGLCPPQDDGPVQRMHERQHCAVDDQQARPCASQGTSPVRGTRLSTSQEILSRTLAMSLASQMTAECTLPNLGAHLASTSLQA
jgi:hypothetical protein